jgi:hypothetical protein
MEMSDQTACPYSKKGFMGKFFSQLILHYKKARDYALKLLKSHFTLIYKSISSPNVVKQHWKPHRMIKNKILRKKTLLWPFMSCFTCSLIVSTWQESSQQTSPLFSLSQMECSKGKKAFLKEIPMKNKKRNTLHSSIVLSHSLSPRQRKRWDEL